MTRKRPSLGRAIMFGWLLPSTFAAIAITPANATVYTVTYTGTVSSGYGQTDPFGESAFYLKGLSYQAVYYYDTSLGTRTTTATQDNLTGLGFDSPVSAVITIGSLTFVSVGQYYAQERVIDDSAYQSVFSYAADSSVTDTGPGYLSDIYYFESSAYNEVSDDLKRMFSSASITEPIDFTVDQVDAIGSGNFTFIDKRYVRSDYSLPDVTTLYYDHEYIGTSVIDHVVIQSRGGESTPPTPPDGAVPEPASWALMIAGFGVIGFAMRKSKGQPNLRFAV